MNMNSVVPIVRALAAFALACLLIAIPTQPAGALVSPLLPEDRSTATEVGNLDVRVASQGELRRDLSLNRVDVRLLGIRTASQAQVLHQAVARLKAASPGAEVRFSSLLGTAEVVRSDRGALTGPAPGRAGKDIVLDFLRANAALYGLSEADLADLRFKGESLNRKSGLRMVRFEQVVNGIPVFQSDTRVTLDREGRIFRVVGLLAPNAPASAAAISPQITAQKALVAAMEPFRIPLDPARMRLRKAAPDGTQAELVTGSPEIPGSVPSHLVYFPLGPGILVPAWQQIVFTKSSGDWNTLVDAGSGLLLWRKDMRSYFSSQEARFSVYVQNDGKTPAESPAPHAPSDVTPGAGTQFPGIARTTVDMSAVADPTASPNGWIDDGVNTTIGNNTDTYLDVDNLNAPNPGRLDDDGRPVGNLDSSGRQRDFLGTGYDYTPPPLDGNPDAGTPPTDPQAQRGTITQLFYLVNWFHDRLYNLGFDEAAGNFQKDNFGRGGLAGDRMSAQAQSGAGTDNAFSVTPPDGVPGVLQMFVWDFSTPHRDGSLDTSIVLHELTHGVSGRLIGNGSGLFWDVSHGMNEGWSDFVALSLLYNSNAFPPGGKYVEAPYATYKFAGVLLDNYLYGIRRFPYSADKTVNPLTWGDADDLTFDISGGIQPSPFPFSRTGATEPHNAGEIWANMLWEIRNRIIGDPAGANGDVPTGNETMLSLVVDSFKMTPINPSYVDGRDALVDADCATNGCANEKWLWASFANRGLGYKAIAPLAKVGIQLVGSYLGIKESFSLPYLDVQHLVVDKEGNDDDDGHENGSVEPGKTVRLSVELLNPWHDPAFGVPGATATLTTSTPGVRILHGGARYPAILARGTALGTPFVFSVPKNVLCGQSLHFTLTTTSSLGTKSVDFTLRVGTPAGTGAPVTYSHTIPGGIAIPDRNIAGIVDAITIPDDLEIAKLAVRIDDLTHPVTSDLVIGFKAPSGYGTSLIYKRGLLKTPPDGGGANFVNTVIDGDSTNDLNQAGAAVAPFTGNWLPAFNSPFWGLIPSPNLHGPDPVDQLSYVQGENAQGVWRIHVSDQGRGNVGQLNGWSLIVTPTAFVCRR